MTGRAGLDAGDRYSSFCFFDDFFPFEPGAVLTSLSFFAKAGGGENAITGRACSTRTNSFSAGGGVVLGLRPAAGAGPAGAAAVFCRYSRYRCLTPVGQCALKSCRPGA